MRVALVGPYPLDTTRFGGGVETSFFNLLRGLCSFEDLELHVVTFARGAESERVVDSGPVPVRYLQGRARLNNLTFYRSDRRLLRRALDDLAPDVVHAQDALGYGYVCLKVARREPVVVSIHGIVREQHKYLARRRDRLQVALTGVPVERYCVHNARYLVQPTTYPETYFGSEIRGRIVDVGNGISDDFFAANPIPDPGRLLFVGGVTERKRLLDLVEALGRVLPSMPDVQLQVAGATSDTAYTARVTARVRELGLEEHVNLLGALSVPQLIEEYRRAALLVLPSAEETSPMAIAEAMAVGVPSVATDVGGVSALVEHGTTGFLVDVGDVDDLAARITELLLDDETRTRFGAAARGRARDRFTCIDVAARVRDVYRRAWEESRTQRSG